MQTHGALLFEGYYSGLAKSTSFSSCKISYIYSIKIMYLVIQLTSYHIKAKNHWAMSVYFYYIEKPVIFD